jgi:tetratricopeptide (TPR) repeat protein
MPKLYFRLPLYFFVRILTVLLLGFISMNIKAQDIDIVDSLKKVLHKTLLSDSLRIYATLNLALEYKNTEPDKALELAKEALTLAEKIGSMRGEALASNTLGSIEILRGDYVQASYHLQKGLMISEKIGDNHLVGSILNNLGTVYQHQSDYAAALSAYKKGMDIRSHIGDKLGVAGSYNNMGMIYEKQGHYTKALEYFFESLKIKELLDKPQTIANTYSNIGRVYNHLENPEASLEYHYKALKIRKEISEKFGTSISLHEIGKVHQELGDFNKAKNYYGKSVALQGELKYQPGLVDNYVQLGEVYYTQHRYDSSRLFLEKAQKLAEQIADREGLAYALTRLAMLFVKTNQMSRAMFYAQHSLQMAHNMQALNLMRDDYFALYEIHKKLKKNDKALYYYELAIATQHSLLDEDKHLEIYKLQTDYEIDKHKTQIQLLDKDKKLKEEELLLRTVERNVLIGSAVILISFAFFIFFRYKEKKRANQLLKEQKAELIERSEEIMQQQDQLAAQNESLMNLNDQVSKQKAEIENMNAQLEHKIIERTTELEEAVEVLIKQKDDLEQFAYIVSHNLRSPIAQVLGLTNLFVKENNLENQEVIEMLRNSAKNLDMVITDLNHVLDIKAQHSHKKYENIKLGEVVQEILAKLSEELQQISATVETKIDRQLETFGIKEYVENVAYQYIHNAIKFRKKLQPLHLEIEVAELNEQIIFKVTDNGLGIFDTKKIFRLYQRQNAEIDGKGLDLFLVKTQMEVLEGNVFVESTEGQGSTFGAYFKKNS